MVSPGLRAVLVEGARMGDLDGLDVTRGEAEHPVCGDRVCLSIRCSADRIVEASWRAAGCPASMAVAALAANVLHDVAAADAPALLRSAIAAKGGLAEHERHAEVMSMAALASALSRSGDRGSGA